jgi:hypothetical protein
MDVASDEPTGWKPWPVKVGDWVTVLPLGMHHVANNDFPDPFAPDDMQPGCTYEVAELQADGPDHTLRILLAIGPDCYITGRYGWCRPATPEEVRAAQLSQLQAGGL